MAIEPIHSSLSIAPIVPDKDRFKPPIYRPCAEYRQLKIGTVNMAQTILVVDDDPVQRRLLETAITRSGMTVVTAPGGQPALDLINGVRGEQITLMLLDLVMPDMGGIEVLSKLRSSNPDLPVIVLTAKGGIDSAVEAMRAGATDFLVKPASPERIAISIRNQLKIGTLSGEVTRLKKKASNNLTFDDLIAGSA